MTMDDSSESTRKKSDYSRGFDSPGVSGSNLMSLHARRLSSSGDAVHDSELRKERDHTSTAQSDQFETGINVSRNRKNVATGNSFLWPVQHDDFGTLRQWLDSSGRIVDAVQCLSIFRQIVGIVNKIHSQGAIFQNLRPSSFALSSLSHISLIESEFMRDSGSAYFSTGKDSGTKDVVHSAPQPHCLGGTVSRPVSEDLLHEISLPEAVSFLPKASFAEVTLTQHDINDGHHIDDFGEDRKSFFARNTPLGTTWYLSPEEVNGGPSSFASDVYRLGVLLFELFCPCITREEKCTTMSSMRNRILPPQLLLRWPKEVSFCLWLLHPDPVCRPQMGELLESELFDEATNSFEDCEAGRELEAQILEQELLLEFLILLHQRKEEASHKLQESISLLSLDIDEVRRMQPSLEEQRDTLPVSSKTSAFTVNIIRHEGSTVVGSRKRLRHGSIVHIDEYDSEIGAEQLAGIQTNQEDVMNKCSRMMMNFKILESSYFLARQRAVKQSRHLTATNVAISSRGGVSNIANERSSMNSMALEGQSENGLRSGWISPFLEGLCEYLSYSRLKVKAEVKQGDLWNSSNLVCALSFDRDGDFFAAAGTNKKIKVFDCDSILNEERTIHYPAVELASESKLSSLCWNAYIKSQIASSNFEGVIEVWDVARNQKLLQMKEHERRVWSVDFSAVDPTLLASGSDDGSVKLWSVNQEVSVCTIKAKANICCVQFPNDSSRTLAFGSADHRIYYYDLRNPRMPLCTLTGHSKTVSYVKFIDSAKIVSASTDSTLKLWDLSMGSSVTPVLESSLQSFSGHKNVKNFVGLSVFNGYIATGSETNEVFVYHKSFPMPAVSFKFNTSDPLSGHETNDAAHFVSAVCWRGQSSTLLAANSTGNIKILEME